MTLQAQSIEWAPNEPKAFAKPVPPLATKREYQIVWLNSITIFHAFIAGIYGGYLFFTKAMWTTVIFTVLLYVINGVGVTAGAHRLWSHKAYKARLPLRVLLIIFNSTLFEGHVYGWARDHRMHHKYSDTDADPHNASNGFFFAQIGWLLVRKHPDIKAKGHTIHMSDLDADQVVQFQKKFYWIIMPFFAYILPTYLPTLWGESLWTAHFVCAHFRQMAIVSVVGLINSAAHMWGNRPYDKHLKTVEIKTLSFFVFGEGFHNFHHTFPWDYKAGELGVYSFNVSALFIDAMAKIGWAYDLKSVSPDIVEKRVKRTGDGTHDVWGNDVAAA